METLGPLVALRSCLSGSLNTLRALRTGLCRPLHPLSAKSLISLRALIALSPAGQALLTLGTLVAYSNETLVALQPGRTLIALEAESLRTLGSNSVIALRTGVSLIALGANLGQSLKALATLAAGCPGRTLEAETLTALEALRTL